MSNSANIPTPRTDAVYLNLEGQDCDAECYETLIEHARALERENAMLRQALKRIAGETEEDSRVSSAQSNPHYNPQFIAREALALTPPTT